MSGSCQDALPDVRKWSGGPPGCLGVVETSFRMSECGRESPGICRSGREALPDVLE